MWDLKKVRKQLNFLLDSMDAEWEQLPHDSSGQVVPASVSLLYILNMCRHGTFFGAFKLTVKGPKFIRPEILNATEKLHDALADYLAVGGPSLPEAKQ